MAAPRRRPEPIPLTLVTGPLGSGKTRFINALMADGGAGRVAVILNGTGRTALAAAPAQSVEDDVIALGGGCICCTVRGALVGALETLLRAIDNRRTPPVDRLLIEAAAAADPAAVIGGIVRHPYLSLRFRPDGIVAALGGDRALQRLAGDGVALRQIATADAIVAAPAATGLAAALGQINPRAEMCRTLVPPPRLARFRFWSDERAPDGPATADRLTESTGSATAVRTIDLGRQRGLPPAEVAGLAEYLAGSFGASLLRCRILSSSDGTTTIARVLGGIVLPPVSRASAGAAAVLHAEATTLDGPCRELVELIDGWTGEAVLDRPDRAALADNPLAIAGFSARPVRR